MMKKVFKTSLLIGILSFLFVFLVGLTSASAQSFKTENDASVILKEYLQTKNVISPAKVSVSQETTLNGYKFLFAKTVLTGIRNGQTVEDSFKDTHKRFEPRMTATGVDLNAIEQEILDLIAN